MYRDDTCAVCGASLPPDHLYCRVHAAEVDDRLHAIAAQLGVLAAGLRDAADLVAGIAGETWDYLAADAPGDPLWPPAPDMDLRVPPEQLEVDVDTEPGFVRARLRLPLPVLLSAVATALTSPEVHPFVEAAAAAEGLNATH